MTLSQVATVSQFHNSDKHFHEFGEGFLHQCIECIANSDISVFLTNIVFYMICTRLPALFVLSLFFHFQSAYLMIMELWQL